MDIFKRLSAKLGLFLLMLKPLFVSFMLPAIKLVEDFKALYNSTDIDPLQFFVNIYSDDAGAKIKLILDSCKNLKLFSKTFEKETDAEQLAYILSSFNNINNSLKDGFYLQLTTQIFLITADDQLKKFFPSIKTREANQLAQQCYVLYKSGYFA